MSRELTNKRILSLALEALKSERERIDADIRNIEERLQVSPPPNPRARVPASRISPAGRKSISEAMKKHWIKRRRRMAKKRQEPAEKAKS